MTRAVCNAAFTKESAPLEAALAAAGKALNGDAAQQLGLVTASLEWVHRWITDCIGKVFYRGIHF